MSPHRRRTIVKLEIWTLNLNAKVQLSYKEMNRNTRRQVKSRFEIMQKPDYLPIIIRYLIMIKLNRHRQSKNLLKINTPDLTNIHSAWLFLGSGVSKVVTSRNNRNYESSVGWCVVSMWVQVGRYLDYLLIPKNVQNKIKYEGPPSSNPINLTTIESARSFISQHPLQTQKIIHTKNVQKWKWTFYRSSWTSKYCQTLTGPRCQYKQMDKHTTKQLAARFEIMLEAG